jgi:hypothetical protein
MKIVRLLENLNSLIKRAVPFAKNKDAIAIEIFV